MVVVLELSSYQIDLARALQPDIAVFLNLSPDHLDRHGGLGGYFAAKRRLFTQGGPSRAIIGVDENEGRFLANVMREDAGTGDPVIAISVDPQARRRRLDRHRPQGLPRRVAPRPPGRLDRPAADADPARRPQPPERLRRLRRRPLASASRPAPSRRRSPATRACRTAAS